MRLRFVWSCLVVAAASTSGLAQQGAPNEGTPQAGPRLKIERDIEYARSGGEALTLDLYRQDSAAAPSAVVVWIHGADPGFVGKAPTPAAALVSSGFAVASIDYRSGAASTIATQVADAKAAVRWLRANAKIYSLDAAHVAARGYGTGGEVAAILGTAGEV